MVSNVGLNLDSTYLKNMQSGSSNAQTPSNIFGLNGLQPINSDYENDILMPDFLKTSSLQTFTQNPQPATAPAQTQEPQQPAQAQTAKQNNQLTQDDIEKYLVNTQIQTPEPKKTNIFKTIGATLGLSAPAIAAFVSKSAVSLKSLALKVPLLGIAGYATGALVDYFINTSNSAPETKTPEQHYNRMA